MTADQRAQLIEDIDRAGSIRKDLATQAKLSHEFAIVAAWGVLTELDASIRRRIDAARREYPLNN